MPSQVRAKFYFADIVVVDETSIGCILKTWHSEDKGYTYEVYNRSRNAIQEWPERFIFRYVVSKELSEQELDWH